MIRPFLHLLFAGCLAASALAAPPANPIAPTAADDFGRNVQLAPFVVRGEKIALSIHARTNADRRYATDFAEEVVRVAYETMDNKSTGAGLVIVGREGEPHPVVMMRKFMAMAEAGQLQPGMAELAHSLDAKLTGWKATLNLDAKNQEADREGPNITFDMIMPALPVPLEGVAAKLYQLAWDEKFDDAKLAARMRTLTVADLESSLFAKYDWVFYLPPRNAFDPVIDQIMTEAMKHEKMGLGKRMLIRTAMVVLKPAIRKAVEGFRKGMLYMSVLQARSGWSKDDIKALTEAYMQVLMPDFKFNDGEEQTHTRVMAAIEKQKVKNAEYAKDPFVRPVRLTEFDPAAYTRFVGDYGTLEKDKKDKQAKPSRALVRENDTWLWQSRRGKPIVLHPAGERLFVSEGGQLTVEFKVGEGGAVTGAEERRVRYRQTFPHPAVEPKKK
ncbi:MAG: hypothetical protein KF715_15400 [Candidatus Didemnitutus sp.]|nr:hypothetical protein [Candidatus Didemnitutus sp.]